MEKGINEIEENRGKQAGNKKERRVKKERNCVKVLWKWKRR